MPYYKVNVCHEERLRGEYVINADSQTDAEEEAKARVEYESRGVFTETETRVDGCEEIASQDLDDEDLE